MTAVQKFPTARRNAYLHGIADAALTEQKESAAILSAHEAEKEKAVRDRIRLGNVAVKARAARHLAVGEAEKACKSFIAAVRDILNHAADERAALAAIGESCETLTAPSVTGRLSRYFSHELRTLAGPTAAAWGGLRLANYFRASNDWTAAERRAVPNLLKGKAS